MSRDSMSLDELAAAVVGVEETDLRELERIRAALSSVKHNLSEAANKLVAEAANLVDLLLSGECGKSGETLAAVREKIGALVRMLEEEAWGEKPPEPGVPSQATAAGVDGAHEQGEQAESAAGLDVDAELLAEFVAESLEHMQNAEAAILSLETDPEDGDSINAVFRAFHTIKGTAGFVGLTDIQDLAHRAESLLDRARNGEIRLTGVHADLVLESIDRLRKMIDEHAQRPAVVDHEAARELAGPSSQLQDSSRTAGNRAQAGGDSTPWAAAAKDSTVRVSTARLDDLINMVGELVIAQAMVAQNGYVISEQDRILSRNVARMGKITRELQDLSMSMRMVPLKSTFQKVTRLARDLGKKSGKLLSCIAEGEETEIDRNMVESLSDPLIHMIRNAVDHGLESESERQAAGKPPWGTLTLRAYHAAGNVVIELEDDGKGLDRQKIISRALTMGLIDGDKELSDSELFKLIFAPGFSTAEAVTDVSGRGVGMDVVKKNIEAMRGRVEVSSTGGKGTTFTIRMPLTLAIIDGMLLRVGSEHYIVPTLNVEHALRPKAEAISTVIGKGEMVLLRGSLIPIFRLHKLFNISGSEEDPTRALLLVVEHGGEKIALLADELLGQQQVVIKSIGKGLAKIEGISGAAILGDGRVGLILDVAGAITVARRYGGRSSQEGVHGSVVRAAVSDLEIAGGGPL